MPRVQFTSRTVTQSQSRMPYVSLRNVSRRVTPFYSDLEDSLGPIHVPDSHRVTFEDPVTVRDIHEHLGM